MKEKKMIYFWVGFLLSAGATAWLYWLFKKKRVITPGPLVISRDESYRPETVKEVKENEEPDKLEVINGIGPATAKLLNDSGIFSYHQLAITPPEELIKISGSSRWDPSDWIAQAKELRNQS